MHTKTCLYSLYEFPASAPAATPAFAFAHSITAQDDSLVDHPIEFMAFKLNSTPTNVAA
jgi:hypothetical protein